jgi:hypothetical protein
VTPSPVDVLCWGVDPMPRVIGSTSLRLVPALDRTDLLAAGARCAGVVGWLGARGEDPRRRDRPGGGRHCGVLHAVRRAARGIGELLAIQAERGAGIRPAACVVLATTRADVNNLVRCRLDARKASFAPMDWAIAETGMEFEGITPIGLPTGWPVLIDEARARGGPHDREGSSLL